MPIRFYFDFISPYAYIAWTQIHDVAVRHGRVVVPQPILFAALLNHHGSKGPAEIAPKRAYVFKDAYRKAHGLGLPPLVPPPTHPFNPLLALRVASIDLEAAARKSLIDALFAATWAGGGGVESDASVIAVCDGIGLDGRDLVAQACSNEAKERLRRQTSDAIESGIFGVPTMVADGELFWGVDSLGALNLFLGGRDPVPQELSQRWMGLRASASRAG